MHICFLIPSSCHANIFSLNGTCCSLLIFSCFNFNNCRSGNFDFLKYLMEEHRYVESNCKDNNGRNPLDIACM